MKVTFSKWCACVVFVILNIWIRVSESQSISVVVFPAAFPFTETDLNNTQNNVTSFGLDVWDNVITVMNTELGYQIIPSYIFTNSVGEFNSLLRFSDIGISGIAVTQDQLVLYGTSIPYRNTVIRSMVSFSSSDRASIYSIWQVLKSPAVLQYLLLFMLFCIPFAHVQWLIEHKRNQDTYHSGYFTGIGASLYWTWITVTTVGYGDKVPKTLWGQVWTVITLIFAIILINLLTGSISANLVIQQLSPEPISILSFAQENVTVIRNSYASSLAQSVDAQLIIVDSIEDGIAALANGSAKYFLHEQAALLAYNQSTASPNLADAQYSFLYPLNSSLSSDFLYDLNFAITTVKSSPVYSDLLNNYTRATIIQAQQSSTDLKDWIAVWVFLGIIVIYAIFLIVGYLIFARKSLPDKKNPTKEDVQEMQGNTNNSSEEITEEEGNGNR